MNHVKLEDFPYGLSCHECQRVLNIGEQYATRVINDDWDESVCPTCAQVELGVADAAHLYLISQTLNPEPSGA